jgi:hypothetical protein
MVNILHTKLNHTLFTIILFLLAQLYDCGIEPCQNGGTCINQPNFLYGYKCECLAGFIGYDCQNSKKIKYFSHNDV